MKTLFIYLSLLSLDNNWIVNIKFNKVNYPGIIGYNFYLRENNIITKYSLHSTKESSYIILGLRKDTIYFISYTYFTNNNESLRSEERMFKLPLFNIDKPIIKLIYE